MRLQHIGARALRHGKYAEKQMFCSDIGMPHLAGDKSRFCQSRGGKLSKFVLHKIPHYPCGGMPHIHANIFYPFIRENIFRFWKIILVISARIL